ncbi:hypothetical protein EOD42_14075 [Rhodovarius crocodyli]|uniref:Uncharacterized protein n=2 Tax=Rhodovarius crocodyli TaxID=1979269 RepID=A0A437MF43_9PROT|nr:hypothetical protein EOD42_14075 [Rhodovarius crocodyli]
MNMARMGVATMTTAGAVLEAGGQELPEDVQQMLSQIAEAGALITTHADHLAQLHAAEEGEDEGEGEDSELEPEDGAGEGEDEGAPTGEKEPPAKGDEGDGDKPGAEADAKPGSAPPTGKEGDEGKKKPKAREPEMALAAKTGELAKTAAAFLAKARPAAAPAPAPAPVLQAPPVLPANAPAARVVPVSKAADGGGEPLAKTANEKTLEELAKMSPTERERAAVFLALRAPPIELPAAN